MTIKRMWLAGVAGLVLTGAAVQPALAQTRPAPAAAAQGQLIPAETFTLDNGLKVIFHIDRSDPVAAVVLAAKVGSARETPGRTGFAHMFEHLFFLNSENLGPGGLDRLSTRVGGSGANGFTTTDITQYLQTVPNDALEKMIWAEADKLGFFINTVTEAVVTKEKEVVKNERRQGVDNQPYGFTNEVLRAALYPADHPYSWSVIGSMADLNAATLDDVKSFYRRWYTPNNSTLVIAGDFDPVQARAWVQKYFGEIPRGEAAPAVNARPARLTATPRLMHEDGFARLPRLTLVWPSVENAHRDVAALNVLAEVLADGKEAPLNAVLVDEKKLTDEVGAYSSNDQISGLFGLQVTAFDGVDLDQVRTALDEGFARFEREGVKPAVLSRIKTQAEAAFYGGLSDVEGKATQLAFADLYGVTPDQELAAIRAVTAADVMRVYRQHVRGRHHVALSFVPKGQAQLALEGSAVARVVEEPIVQGAEAAVDQTAGRTEVQRTPSAFDRTQEPPAGPTPVVTPPVIWTADLPNGLKVSGVETAELPLVSFQLSVDGGRLFDDPQKPGAANLLARLMDRGTKTRTPAELENAFKSLGASVNVTAGDERFIITGSTLARNFAATIDLVEEMLFEPRWDETELELAKAATRAELQASMGQPNAIAARTYSLLSYGPDHILSRNRLGTDSSIDALTMEDLKALLTERWTPANARFRLVGAVDQATARAALADLGARWTRREVRVPDFPMPQPPTESRVYFYDVPGARQSVLVFGRPALTRADPNYFTAVASNFILGGGGFASRMTQELREGKGYTYGASTRFTGGQDIGAFTFNSGVRANVTLEAAQLARDIMRDYPSTFTAEDLEITRGSLIKSRARSFETFGDKLGILADIGDFGLPADYVARETAVLESLTLEQVRDLARRFVTTDQMYFVVVGDAATQAQRLEALGYGPVVRVNEQVAAADR